MAVRDAWAPAWLLAALTPCLAGPALEVSLQASGRQLRQSPSQALPSQALYPKCQARRCTPVGASAHAMQGPTQGPTRAARRAGGDHVPARAGVLPERGARARAGVGRPAGTHCRRRGRRARPVRRQRRPALRSGTRARRLPAGAAAWAVPAPGRALHPHSSLWACSCSIPDVEGSSVVGHPAAGARRRGWFGHPSLRGGGVHVRHVSDRACTPPGARLHRAGKQAS